MEKVGELEGLLAEYKNVNDQLLNDLEVLQESSIGGATSEEVSVLKSENEELKQSTPSLPSPSFIPK